REKRIRQPRSVPEEATGRAPSYSERRGLCAQEDAMNAWAKLAVLTLAALMAFAPNETRSQSRIKDIVSVEGVRENQLVGYGIVVGLNGTGDRPKNVPFTERSLKGMLERLGVNVRDDELKT